jgi:hypothetical protein
MSVDESDPAMSSSTESNNNNNNNNSTKKTTNDAKNKKDKSDHSNNKNVSSNKKIDKPDADVEKADTEPETSPTSRTVTVDCSLCGKQFGRNSINFHTRQCQRKQQAIKEKQEQEQLEEKRQSSYIIEEDVGELKNDLQICFKTYSMSSLKRI